MRALSKGPRGTTLNNSGYGSPWNGWAYAIRIPDGTHGMQAHLMARRENCWELGIKRHFVWSAIRIKKTEKQGIPACVADDFVVKCAVDDPPCP